MQRILNVVINNIIQYLYFITHYFNTGRIEIPLLCQWNENNLYNMHMRRF